MTLFDLQQGETGIITKIRGRGAFRKRIIEMGFIKGEKVKVLRHAPMRDPIEYEIKGYLVSLRGSEAMQIEVVTEKEAYKSKTTGYNGILNGEVLKQEVKEKIKTINVALVGNPNSGKTTLFNYASGAREHVGNYSGVTVDSKEAVIKFNDYTINIVDLPGTYSLSAFTPEELFVRKHILGTQPDIVLNVIDASNLERNLFLTTQLIDMDIKIVVALNMYDELKAKGDKFNYESLGSMLGMPFVPTVASKGRGIKELFERIIDVYEDKAPCLRYININHGTSLESAIEIIQDKIWKNKTLTDRVSSRFYAIKILEKDEGVRFTLSKWENYPEIMVESEQQIKKLENLYNEDVSTLISEAKYGFISGALKETYTWNPMSRKKKTDTEIIDTFITHKIFGFPIFIGILWLMFQGTFGLGYYPMTWIESLVEISANTVDGMMAGGMLKDLVVDGIFDGVGGVIVFLPNILFLFFFISLMEDTGYMARAAFIMDKLMHRIGLHGKSFIPLIMGFGCNVPAIMATRTLENKSDRLLTILINPFMSCSARLPVYILITSAFFPNNAGTIIFLIYLTGIIVAILMAMIFKRAFFRKTEAPFVMELPPYRMPTFKAILKHMWFKASQYLKKMGGVILVASIIIWALGYFPRNINYSKDYEQIKGDIESYYIYKTATTTDSLKIKAIEQEKISKIQEISLIQESERQELSYIGQIGKFIEPIIKPLGFDWRMGVSLVSGIAAKEIIVSTMGVLFQVEEDSQNIGDKLKNYTHAEGPKKGQKVFTPLVAVSFLIFILLYFPCIAVFAAVRKETASLRWALFLVFYTTALAWLLSFMVFQIGSLF